MALSKRLSFAFALALSLAGCTRDDATPSGRLRPLSPLDGAPAALLRKAPDELLVDLASDGRALVGRVQPALPDSDQDRTLTARVIRPDGTAEPMLAGAPLSEVRFLPGSTGLLVITADHTLVRLASPGAAPETLEHEVYGPMSLSHDGHRVAYTRGEPPMLSTVLRDLSTGRVERPAPELVPAWCPTLSHDGRELIVATSANGQPELWRVHEGAPPARWNLPAGTPFPTGPTAPVLYGDALVFENETGVHSLGLDGTLRRSIPGLHNPVLDPSRATLFAGRGASAVETSRVDRVLLSGAR